MFNENYKGIKFIIILMHLIYLLFICKRDFINKLANISMENISSSIKTIPLQTLIMYSLRSAVTIFFSANLLTKLIS